MKTKLTFALLASLTSTAFAAFQAPLPEFKNERQLAEWRAEKADEATSQGYAAEEKAFYTGRPYLEAAGGYAFKYRTYDPNLTRWTSEDPSGFPDGANGSRYAPTPTTQVDLMGLVALDLTGSTAHDITAGNVTMKVKTEPKQIGTSAAAMTDVTFTVADGVLGWLVQQVTNDWSKVLNKADGTPHQMANPPTQNYWEAWAVPASGVIGGGLDNWNTPGFNEDITKGSYTTTGKVGFYTLAQVAKSSPTSWGIQAAESGVLPLTTTKPAWWTGGFERTLTMKWE